MPAKSPIRRRSGYAQRSPSSASRSGYAKRSPTPATQKSKDPCAALKLKLKERDAEFKESRAQQAAVSDILRVISGTATDVKPVLQSIAEHAMWLCQSVDARIWLVEGDRAKYVTGCGGITPAKEGETVPLVRGSGIGRAIVDRKAVHIKDAATVSRKEFPILREMQRLHGGRTLLAVPLMREKKALGTIILRKMVVEPFTKRQIELVRTFANQAAIVIENVRLFNETREALEQQTATADILRIISGSLTDTQPAFDAIVRNCGNLFEGSRVVLWLLSDDRIHRRAISGAAASEVPADDVPLDRGSAIGACVLDGRMIHLPDLEEAAEQYPRIRQLGLKWGYRSGIYAPLLREGRAIGGFAVLRWMAGAFNDKEVALLKTFADQAVIAIENVRLFKELQARNAEVTEALEQQTATSEVLKVISSSPTDLKPVFDAILDNATRLCDAHMANLYDGDANLTVVAQRGASAEYAKWVTNRGPFRPTVHSTAAQMIAERRPIHVADLRDSSGYRDRTSRGLVALVDLGGARSGVLVPMLKEGRVVGAITIYRPEVRPFSQKQIDLVSTFANQAVIAIENVRLFNETKEALEQQTVISEILRVISSSPTDTQPVFETIVKSGVHLFGGMDVSLRLVKGDYMETVASTLTRDTGDVNPVSVDDDGRPAVRAILRREVIQVPDYLAAEDWVSAKFKQRAQQRGFRAVMVAPMLRENNVIGTIGVFRATPGRFSDKQVALLKTFADQAVIAIENVRLFKELQARNAEITEALEQQTATAEILKVISSSPTNLQPVFDAILENAIRLCDAHMGHLRLYDGEKYRNVALRGASAEYAKFLSERGPFRPGPGGFYARMTAERQPIQIADSRDSPAYRDRLPNTVALVELGGARTSIAVPMLKEGRILGAITIYRREVRPFTQKQIDLVSTFANQAVIAIENVRLFNETKEALEQQTVISEILRVISSSPTDTQPVFDAIVKSGLHLFGGMQVGLRLVKGDQLETVARTNPLDIDTQVFDPLDDEGMPSSRAILRRDVVQIPDYLTAEEWVSPKAKQRAEKRGFRALMSAPMLRENNAIGTINVVRAMPGPFSDKQIALLKTFANQAVIAIENVRLFKELQARNAEVTEALEQQTATAEILKVISGSPTDLKPVFDAILENATRLCNAHMANLSLHVGDTRHTVAQRGGSAEFAQWLMNRGPYRPYSGGVGARMIAEQRPFEIPDLKDSSGYRDRTPGAVALVELGGARSCILVPMLKEGRVVGSITIYRPEVRPFTQKQIDLVSTFADQAVIAIENVRLFNETKEALEQQTVISEILRVIGSSPTDTQPVFDAIVKSGVHLFGGMNVTLRLVKGDHIETVASTRANYDTGDVYPVALDDDSGPALRAIRRREVAQVPDFLAAEAWVSARSKQRAERRGYRALMSAPLLRENNAIGTISVTRATPGAFSDKEIVLLKTFADQAVIAIENVRLFKELQARNAEITEALEQQTATADILKVISSSPTDTQPVFDAVAESAARLCEAHDVVIRLVEGNEHCAVAHYGPIPVMPPHVITRGQLGGRAIIDAQTVHIPDVTEADVREEFRETFSATTGQRTFLAVPLLREGRAIGLIVMRRLEVRPFTDKQIKLLETFAAQAVIAIENVRLFKELQARNTEITEALEQQTATAEILKVISGSPTDIQPVFDTVVRTAARLCEASDVVIRRLDADVLRLAAHFGPVPIGQEAVGVSRKTFGGRAVLERRTLHVPDVTDDYVRTEYPETISSQRPLTYRSVLVAPLLREGTPIGIITMRRPEAQPFSDQQVKLLETFAAQAVIAIENVRLFKELQARNVEVTEALEQQTATAEILKVISSSPTDLKPVFDAILDNATRLCDAHMGHLGLYDGEKYQFVAQRGANAEYAKFLSERGPFRPLPSSPPARMIAERQTIQDADVAASSRYRERSNPATVALVELGGARTFMFVPMLKEGQVVGGISIYRPEVRPFSQKQIDLVSTFASQAVIAIENVRLFNEIQDKSRQLEIASRHKSEFLASMSHELRTPLNAILGFNEMIIREIYGEVPADMKEPLEDIQASGKHLLRLINNVLDLAKIEAGRMELALGDYSISDIVESVRSTLRPLAAEKNLEFVVTVPEDIPDAYGDSGRITQCLVNLAGNSLKFTKAGKVEISVRHYDGRFNFCVADTGVGIPPEKIGSLFTEFKQTDATIASEYGGTGLGLSITRKFIEMHGGRIWVESEVGKGSRFIFEIPVRVEAQAEAGERV